MYIIIVYTKLLCVLGNQKISVTCCYNICFIVVAWKWICSRPGVLCFSCASGTARRPQQSTCRDVDKVGEKSSWRRSLEPANRGSWRSTLKILYFILCILEGIWGGGEGRNSWLFTKTRRPSSPSSLSDPLIFSHNSGLRDSFNTTHICIFPATMISCLRYYNSPVVITFSFTVHSAAKCNCV